MKCPKCGYQRQAKDNAFVAATECPACGIVYTKHEDGPLSKLQPPAPPMGQHQTPSPVDASSLKLARERVDKRLRKKLEARVHDKRHAQTLERARRIAAEEVLKRRQQWEQTHGKKDSAKETEDKLTADGPSEERQSVDSTPAIDLLDAIDPPVPQETHEESTEKPPAADPVEAGTVHDDESAAADEVHPANGMEPAPTEQTPSVDSDVEINNAELKETDAPNLTVTPEASESVRTDAQEDPTIQSADPEETEKPEESEQGKAPQDEAASQEAEEDDSMDQSRAEASTPDKPLDESGPDIPIPPPVSDAHGPYSHPAMRGGGLTSLFPMVAWLILVAGVIGAVLSWTTLSDAEAGVRLPIHQSLNAVPLGLLLGFAYLATGVLGFAFFWVSSLINRQLKDIRRLLLSHPVSMFEDKSAPVEEAGDDEEQ